ncbi:VOC family protein [Billgrantia endophytica]|uniref:VOC family protein n=1 Tax=Billgrantia endophytica TaxID=2033802 RepID=A0A2N7U7U1_9GAMM|nr:VOC family protein [Halomonas endophytica]PMR76469.1 VOC family protein [Halomonas endophytica]
MAHHVTTHLMFNGVAEQAMRYYTSLFDDAEVTRIERYGPDEAGAEGSIRSAEFSLAGHRYLCIDSPVRHDFTFTPSMSLFVECEGNDEFEHLYMQLTTDGEVLMPPDDYGFSARFAWLNDRFGVSWQLNLA